MSTTMIPFKVGSNLMAVEEHLSDVPFSWESHRTNMLSQPIHKITLPSCDVHSAVGQLSAVNAVEVVRFSYISV